MKRIRPWLLTLTLTALCCSPQVEQKDEAVGAPPEAAAKETLRLLLQTRDETDPGAVSANLSQHYASATYVERLFPDVDPADDPEHLSRIFLALVPARAGEGPWDAAHALEAEPEYVRVEPDTDRTLEIGLERAGSCTVDREPPSDKAWSLKNMRADAAWKLEPMPGAARYGEGIRVCHPDTGWSDHDELPQASLDLAHARNLLKDGTPDAKDPLDYSGEFLHPGHGTATGSTIISSLEGQISGAAPKARLVPIRTAKSVIQIFDSDLARAIRHSVATKCDVISMSLGGRVFFGLKAAIQNAVRNNILVMAAAGNCVGFVVAPAAYESCLAIGGSNIDDKPWRGSSHGTAVALSAPAELVWTAKRRPGDASTTGLYAAEGTSFAVANVAGAGALWLAYHGPGKLKAAYPGVPLQEVFRRQAQTTARRPDGWDTSEYGAGILDVEALLSRPLPRAADLADAMEEFPAPEAEALIDLSRVVGRDPKVMAALMAKLFKTSEVEVLPAMGRWAPEMAALALENPPEFERLLEALASPLERDEPYSREYLGDASRALKRALE